VNARTTQYFSTVICRLLDRSGFGPLDAGNPHTSVFPTGGQPFERTRVASTAAQTGLCRGACRLLSLAEPDLGLPWALWRGESSWDVREPGRREYRTRRRFVDHGAMAAA
jgi:hypothetical protein